MRRPRIRDPSETRGLSIEREIERSISESYKRLPSPWLEWGKIARIYETKVRHDLYDVPDPWDREDLRHDIIIKLYEAYLKYGSEDRNLSTTLMSVIASNCAKDYWRALYKQQRYESTSLDEELESANDEDESMARHEIIPDKRAIDPQEYAGRAERDDWKQNYSKPLIKIAEKLDSDGRATLTSTERQALWRHRKKHGIRKAKKGAKHD